MLTIMGEIKNTRRDELETFKTAVNLTEYAAACGYELDRQASSRNSVCMRHPAGDKIVIGRASDGHWIYMSVRDTTDNGTIIDFIQHRQNLNLGQVRQELRPWLNPGASPLPNRPASSAAPSRPPSSAYVPHLEPVTRDLVAVRARHEAAHDLADHGYYHRYLCEERTIPPALLASSRFSDTFRIDQRGNVLFGHRNEDGLSGFEIKNSSFTGFAPGGTKGLWGSREEEDDNRLVVAETAIDALSYAALHGYEHSRFLSIAGQMNPQQPALLRLAMQAMPPHSEIIAAVDHDAGGDAILESIERVFRDLELAEASFRRHSPPVPGQDWNDVLRASVAQETPSPGEP